MASTRPTFPTRPVSEALGCSGSAVTATKLVLQRPLREEMVINIPTTTQTVLYEKRDGVAYITLNRPESLNALNREFREGLREALAELRDDPEVLLAIMTGAGGRAFSAGMDLKERAQLD